jgi:hypothetical protein
MTIEVQEVTLVNLKSIESYVFRDETFSKIETTYAHDVLVIGDNVIGAR